MTTDLALTPAASAAAATVAIKAEVRSIVVSGPDAQALLDAVAVDLLIVPDMEIDSADLAEEMKASLGRLATVHAAIEAERTARKAPLLEAGKWLDGGYNPIKIHVRDVMDGGRKKLDQWNADERQRILREQEEEAAAARQRAAEAAAAEAAAIAAANQAVADAQKLAEAGSEQVAAAMQTQAMVAVDTARQNAAQAAAVVHARPLTLAKAPKAQGVTWKAECIDKAKLLQHIGERIAAGDKSLMNLVEIDPKAINALAKLQEAALNVPGLRPYTEARTTRIAKVAVAA